MKNIVIFAIGLLTLATGAAQTVPAPDCKNYEAALTGDEQKYENQFKDDQDQSDKMKGDSVALGGTIDWKDQTIIFNVPSVTIKDQKLIFGVPQVTMNNQHIIFDTPTVTMKTVKTGQYPETTCTDTWIEIGGFKTKGVPACTITWHDIITSVPQTSMQRQDIVMGVPEFKWADTQIIMGIPEVTSQQVKWIIGLPQFTVKSIAINSQKIQDQSTALQNDVATRKVNMVNDLTGDIHGEFSCYRASIVTQRTAADAQFNSGLAQMDNAIRSTRNVGADPSNMKDAAGNGTNLVTQRADLAAKRDQAQAAFDAAAKQLDDSEIQAIQKIHS
jgi:hypothetical protein